ncbi:MAG: hypothetical protein Q3962_05325 [Corynebacterium sp.]|nr:hypothetical protein [Corynebacterium sp.]
MSLKKKFIAGVLAASSTIALTTAPAKADQIDPSQIQGAGDVVKAIGPMGTAGILSSGSSYLGSSATPWALWVNPFWWLGALMIGSSRSDMGPAMDFATAIPKSGAFDIDALRDAIFKLGGKYVKIPSTDDITADSNKSNN